MHDIKGQAAIGVLMAPIVFFGLGWLLNVLL